MGDNRWPRKSCTTVFDEDAFVDAVETVSVKRDGGIVVAVDGEIEAQMVRFRDPWHPERRVHPRRRRELRAVDGVAAYERDETSVRPEVVATVTLSEETGRVSVFRNGDAESMERNELGGCGA